MPLTYDQLLKYIRCDHSLEAELNLQPSSRKISTELKEALEQTILPNVADPNKNYLYSTLWTAVLKEENSMQQGKSRLVMESMMNIKTEGI